MNPELAEQLIYIYLMEKNRQINGLIAFNLKERHQIDFFCQTNTHTSIWISELSSLTSYLCRIHLNSKTNRLTGRSDQTLEQIIKRQISLSFVFNFSTLNLKSSIPNLILVGILRLFYYMTTIIQNNLFPNMKKGRY